MCLYGANRNYVQLIIIPVIVFYILLLKPMDLLCKTGDASIGAYIYICMRHLAFTYLPYTLFYL